MLADDDGQPDRRRSRPQSPVKNLGTAVIAVSLIGSIFAAGYNWRSVAIVESNQEQFVRKDVQAEQLQRLNDRLFEVIKQLEDMRAEQRAARRKE